MAEVDDGALSDGSDFDIADAELEEAEEIEEYDHVADLWANLLGESDDENQEEFRGFIGEWTADPNSFKPAATNDYLRARCVNVPLPTNPKASDFFFLFWDEAM